MNTLQLGQASNSLDGAVIGVQNGTAFAMPAAASSLTWQTILPSAPASITVLIQTSNDNSNWSTEDTSTSTTGAIRTFSTSALFVRARVSAVSGGDFVTVILVAKRLTTTTSTLAELTDVTISSPSAGQVLTYDIGSSKWINTGIATGAIVASDTQVIYMDGTQPSGDSGLTYNKTTDILTLTAGLKTSTVYASNPGGNLIGIRIGGSDVSGQGAILTLESDSNDSSTPGILVYTSKGTMAAPAANGASDTLLSLLVNGYDGSDFQLSSYIEFKTNGAPSASHVPGRINFYTDPAVTPSFSVTSLGIQLQSGMALQSDTTTAHTALLQAYDVDGTAYKTFGTLTNGNTPDFSIVPPSGGTITLQATTYKSSDGSTGATASITTGDLVGKTAVFKNGLLVSYGA